MMSSTDTQRREVITVLGTIAPEEMGITQTHEHLLIDAMDHYGTYDMVIDDEELVVEEATEQFSQERRRTSSADRLPSS